MAKTSFLEVKLRTSEIHLQQQIHDTSKDWLKNDYSVLYKSTLILLWCQNRNFDVLNFGWKSLFLTNLNTNFWDLADKVLKSRAIIELVSNLMLNYSTYIYLCIVYLKNPPKYFRFYLKIRHFYIQIYFVKCMYCFYCISGHCHIKKKTFI